MSNVFEFAQSAYDNAAPGENFERQDYIDAKIDELFTDGDIEVNGSKIDITPVLERANHKGMTQLLCSAALGNECLEEIREAMQKAALEVIEEALGDE